MRPIVVFIGNRVRMKSRGKKVKPVRNTLYGRDLLAESKLLDPDRWGGSFETEFIRRVGKGLDYASIARRFDMSYEMAQYTVRRLLIRYRVLGVLDKGLEVMRNHCDKIASAGLTATQKEVLQMLLAGRSQAEAAKTLHITQAAVSSRLRLASRLLNKAVKDDGNDWIKPLVEAVETRRNQNTITSFQRKRRKRKS